MKNQHSAKKYRVCSRLIRGMIIVIGILIAFMACNKKDPADQPPSNRSGYRRISAEEAKKIMDTAPGAIILDVRTKEEYAERHIARSTLLCVTELEKRASTVLPDKDAQILVYCRRGRRSQIAANALLSMGYKNVIDFGGLDTWRYGTVRE